MFNLSLILILILKSFVNTGPDDQTDEQNIWYAHVTGRESGQGEISKSLSMRYLLIFR